MQEIRNVGVLSYIHEEGNPFLPKAGRSNFYNFYPVPNLSVSNLPNVIFAPITGGGERRPEFGRCFQKYKARFS